MDQIESRHKVYINSSTEIMDTLLEEMENSYLSLGLTLEQEKAMSDIVNKALNQALDLRDSNFDQDIALLNAMMSMFNRIVM